MKNAFVNQEFPQNSGVFCPATWVWRLSKRGYVATADSPEVTAVTEMGHVSKKMWPASGTLCSSQQSSGGLYQLASVCARMSGSSRRSAFKLGKSVCAHSPLLVFLGRIMCCFSCISRKNKKAMVKITSQPSAELNMLTSFTGAAEGGVGGQT